MSSLMFTVAVLMMLSITSVASKPFSSNDFLGLGRLFDFGGGSRVAVPHSDETKTKRSALDDVLNNDANYELKQHISLKSLIENVESNLLHAASSANGVAHSGTPLAEVTPGTKSDQFDASASHLVVRQTAEGGASTSSLNHATTAAPPHTTDSTLLLQTTHKVPASEAGGSVLLIDRIAVQPYTGGLPPSLPAFQLVITHKHSEDSNVAAASESKTTQTPAEHESSATTPAAVIAITHTGTATAAIVETSTHAAYTKTPPTSTAAATTTSTTSAAPTTITTSTVATTKLSEVTITDNSSEKAETPKTPNIPLEELEKAEEDLKEKVFEIEADPVILSTRI